MHFSKVTLVAAIAVAAGAEARRNPIFDWAPYRERYTKISVMGAGDAVQESPSYSADYPAPSVVPEPEETPVDYAVETTMEYVPETTSAEYAPETTSVEYAPETTSVEYSSTEEYKTEYETATSDEYAPMTTSVKSSCAEEHKTDCETTSTKHEETTSTKEHKTEYPVETTSTEHKVEYSTSAPHYMPTGYAHPTEHKPDTTTAPYKPTGHVEPHPVYNVTETITNIKTATCTLEHGCPKPTGYVHPETLTIIYTAPCDHATGCPKPTGTPYHHEYNQTYAPTHNMTHSCPEGVKCEEKHCPEGHYCPPTEEHKPEHPTEEHKPEIVHPAPCPSGYICPAPSGGVPGHESPAASGYKPGHAAPTGTFRPPPQYTGAATVVRASGVALAGTVAFALYFL